MNLLSTPEFKVGLLVVVVSILIGVMSMKVSESPSFITGTKRVWFEIENANGLIKKSPVNVAGIRVGVIDDIKLKDGKAIVEMIVRADIVLTESSKIEIHANGILGDKQVEIIPGPIESPVLGNPEQRIQVVEDNASIDQLMIEIGKITKSLSVITDNIRDATEGNREKPLGKIITNLASLTGNLSNLVEEKKTEVSNMIGHLQNVTETLDNIVNNESSEGFQARFQNSMASLERTLASVDEISNKIKSGEGTIGRLVNDEETVEELNTAIAGVNQFIQAGSKLQTSFDYYSHYFTNGNGVRSYIGTRIQPGLDRFYEIAGVSSPEGVITRFTRTTTTNGSPSNSVVEENNHQYKLRFTALFGKTFYNLSVKGGLIENRGGLGLEYNFYRNHFRLSVDAFDFDTPNLRAYLRYNFFKGLYVVGGQQYILENGNNNSASFIGAGLFLTNDDIKYALSRINL